MFFAGFNRRLAAGGILKEYRQASRCRVARIKKWWRELISANILFSNKSLAFIGDYLF
jgi:hypothetical protein